MTIWREYSSDEPLILAVLICIILHQTISHFKKPMHLSGVALQEQKNSWGFAEVPKSGSSNENLGTSENPTNCCFLVFILLERNNLGWGSSSSRSIQQKWEEKGEILLENVKTHNLFVVKWNNSWSLHLMLSKDHCLMLIFAEVRYRMRYIQLITICICRL